MARIDDLLRAESLGILDRVPNGQADLDRARRLNLAPPGPADLGSKSPEAAAALAASGARPTALGIEAMPESLAAEMEARGMGYNERADVSVGALPMALKQGVQQILQGGELTPEQQADVRAWRALPRAASTGAGQVDWLPDAGTVGELAGGLGTGALAAPVAAPALAGPVTAGAAAGGVSGAAQPVLPGESRARNTAAGVLLGGALPMAAARFGRGIPEHLMKPEALDLAEQGVTPAVGSATRVPVLSRLWEGLESLGSIVAPGRRTAAREQAMDLMARRATPPGGRALPLTGRAAEQQQAFSQLRQQFTEAYDAIHSQMRPVNARHIARVLEDVARDTPGLADKHRNRIRNELLSVIEGREDELSGRELGNLLTTARERLRDAYRGKKTRTAQAFQAAVDRLESIQAARLPAEARQTLSEVNRAYGHYSTLLGANRRSGGLTPENIAREARATVSPRVHAEGTDRFRDITDAAAVALPRARSTSDTLGYLGGGLAAALTAPVGVVTRPLVGTFPGQRALRQAMETELARRAAVAAGIGTASPLPPSDGE